jgi:hypothetical protein
LAIPETLGPPSAVLREARARSGPAGLWYQILEPAFLGK